MLMLCTVPTKEREIPEPGAEDALLRAIGTGDEEALEALYSSVRIPVFAYALSILQNREDAEDVLHDSFLKIWEAAPRYRSEGKPRAWILTITKNLCRMKLRERAKTAQTPVEEMAWSLPSEELSLEERTVLRVCLEQLPEDDRQVLLLHAVAGLRHREIAALIEKPLSTVLSKYNRAIRKIRKILEGGVS